jgi:hypothetical protein
LDAPERVALIKIGTGLAARLQHQQARSPSIPGDDSATSERQRCDAVQAESPLDVVTAGAAIPITVTAVGAAAQVAAATPPEGRERGFASWSSGWEQRPQVLGVVLRNR